MYDSKYICIFSILLQFYTGFINIFIIYISNNELISYNISGYLKLNSKYLNRLKIIKRQNFRLKYFILSFQNKILTNKYVNDTRNLD